MPYEGPPPQETTPEAREQARLYTCIERGECPRCGTPVDPRHTSEHLGFCTEEHLHNYQTERDTDVRTAYVEASGEHDHNQYLTEWAERLGISRDVFEALHDKQGMSPNEIREHLAQYRVTAEKSNHREAA